MIRCILVALVLVAACRKDAGATQDPDPAQPTGADPVADTTVPQSDEGGAPEDTAEPDANTCVPKCVASRQMQAIAPEMIQKNCEDDCASGKFVE